ncbi:Persistence and stress-resistance toxin PasT [Zhongshania aliphaticivorans]|uniref:Persistence and stress-resistance toxin PasT n=1 Tax=Zhongshania aliphaticivorans TaxID=1470434 RepID=A0A5S9MVI6_9GAMM|nr:type II toxin-antitoxin system RatA family toxin [Zhongshania aliphaticivorans]CAA0081462.1 Persistence and stress-resistance toxin PasT [Zhongshania aliphaticivorans]CAA0085003.1 Persistence and stress-resistance toxin PasT [Zhongshania aliphaticivorans]
MNEIRRSALLPYPAEVIYRLINDIEAYPQYMDGCVGAEVLARSDDAMDARLDLSRAGIRLSFVTRNTLTPDRSVKLTLLEGPFENLSGEWTLLPLGADACKVSLHLQFVLTNSLVGAATRQLFNAVANNLVDALVKRANEQYGK